MENLCTASKSARCELLQCNSNTDECGCWKLIANNRPGDGNFSWNWKCIILDSVMMHNHTAVGAQLGWRILIYWCDNFFSIKCKKENRQRSSFVSITRCQRRTLRDVTIQFIYNIMDECIPHIAYELHV